MPRLLFIVNIIKLQNAWSVVDRNVDDVPKKTCLETADFEKTSYDDKK